MLRNADLRKAGLHRLLRNLIVDSFEAKWKMDDDPNDFGEKMFGPDNVHRVEYIETVLDNAAGLYILHPSMMKDDWVKAELDDVMHTFMESGKRNHVLITIDFVD